MHTAVNGNRITGTLNITQVFFTRDIVSLIATVDGAAITDKVLGRCNQVILIEECAVVEPSLKTFNQIASKGSYDGRILRETFVGTSPAIIAHNGNGRRKGPIQAGDKNLFGRHSADAMHQRWIIRRA